MSVKLKKEQLGLFMTIANQVYDGENNWYYLPYWYKQISEDVFEVVEHKDIPKKVLEILNDLSKK